ncbi:unnamed protein product [Ectocarpus sp. CCAP 1310/34]|nr:unnamed protein product [Ectocarpus sp. CCAP 1310/34]
MEPPLVGEPGAAPGGGGRGGRRPPPGLGTAADMHDGGKNLSRRKMLGLSTAEHVRGGGSNLLSRRESSSASKETRRRNPPLQPGREAQQEIVNRNSFRPLREDPEEEKLQQFLRTNSRSLPEDRERGHLQRDSYPTPRGDGGLGRGAHGDRWQHLSGREQQHPRDEEDDGPGGELELERRVSGAGCGDGSLSRTAGAWGDRAGSGDRGKGGFREAPLTSMLLRKQHQHQHQQKQPQPPGFVVHAEEVFKWMGVEGLTPEVLRRAKRGLREEAVAGKMWRALLRVALLHLDATRRRGEAPAAALASATTAAAAAADAPGRPETIPDTPAATATRPPAGGSSSGPVPVPVSASVPPRSNYDGARDSGRTPVWGWVGGEEGAAAEVPLPVVMETCGYLLPLWGYRRKAFIEGIKACDVLQTRELLLALSWMMAKAKAFPAFEQSRLVSPLPTKTPANPTPPQGGNKSASSPPPPPPFPRDVSETPEVRRVSAEAFAAFLAAEERRSVPPPDWGGRLGKEEAVRMGEAEAKGEGMARALGAAREMMSCYGGLEAELRVVEGLETARQRMLRRMRSLFRDVAESHPGSGKVAASLRTIETGPGYQQQQQQQQQQQRQQQPSAMSTSRAGTADATAMPGRAGATTAAGTAAASATQPTTKTASRCQRPSRKKHTPPAEASPFCLCLVAGRSPGELSRSLAKVSRAREVLDALDEGREHAGRWCRWASSALVAAESAPPPRSGAVSGAAAGSRGAPRLPEDTASLIAAAATISEPAEDNQATGDVRDATLRQTWCLQEGLERRVRAALPPAAGTPAAGSPVPSWLSAAIAMLEPTRRDGSAPMRTGRTYGHASAGPPGTARPRPNVGRTRTVPIPLLSAPPCVGCLCLTTTARIVAFVPDQEGIDLRLGEAALTTTLEEQRIQRQRQRQQRRQHQHQHQYQSMPEQQQQQQRHRPPALHTRQAFPPTSAVEEVSCSRDLRGHDGGSEAQLLAGSSSPAESALWDRNADKGTGVEWAGSSALERSRVANRERLESLLSACVEAMPLEPRGGGW